MSSAARRKGLTESQTEQNNTFRGIVMRFLVHLTAATLLAAIGIGGMTAAAAADRDTRAEVLGRQKIREELSAALAKGYLTRMDQYHILLHAKEVLAADDLQGLEQTLNRIATQQAAARAAETAARSDVPVQPGADDGGKETVTPSKYEEPDEATGGPTPRKAKAPGESPFVEEVPSSIGKPAIQLDNNDPEGCVADDNLLGFRWVNIDLFSSVDGFKGPIDVGNANGNFGERLGVNAAVKVLPGLGVGLQAGTAAVLSNLKGSPYPEPNATIRDQIFTTVGMFQRINREQGVFTWGFAYDWLFDDYYSNFHFGQWRVKAAYESIPATSSVFRHPCPSTARRATSPISSATSRMCISSRLRKATCTGSTPGTMMPVGPAGSAWPSGPVCSSSAAKAGCR